MNNTTPHEFPDLRRPGALARILVLVESVNLFGILLQSENSSQVLDNLVGRQILLEWTLLISLASLAVIGPWLKTRPYRIAAACTVALVVTYSLASTYLLAVLDYAPPPDLYQSTRTTVFAILICALTLTYFHWRQLATAPSLHEARLLALAARMKPHFLFNSLNCALALIPDSPAKAEAVLEDLSELLKALMNERSANSTLGEEKHLAQCYCEIEQLRLGERLRMEWLWSPDIDAIACPSFILQPLVENAVVHGISPNPAGGVVTVSASRRGSAIVLSVRNPLPAERSEQGNNMAISNIRERLALNYDGQAELSMDTSKGEFSVVVRIPLPYGIT